MPRLSDLFGSLPKGKQMVNFKYCGYKLLKSVLSSVCGSIFMEKFSVQKTLGLQNMGISVIDLCQCQVILPFVMRFFTLHSYHPTF